jgi:membrane-bound serine protease (ClpP class)
MLVKNIMGNALLCALFIFVVFPAELTSAQTKRPVYNVITVSSAVTPPIAEYILETIDESTKQKADGLVILLDTPGGLDLAMRDITKGILNAKIPIIVFVYPAGSRAASAGVIITIAAHIAAMAPGTNIGAAHPVGVGIGSMDKIMMKKVENDAIAYAKGIAQKRGRNIQWVEKSVKKSESITAEEALSLNVVDYLASDIHQLFEQINGREVMLSSGPVVINTKNAIINYKKMGWRQNVLAVLSNPNIAYILLLIGLAGLYFEFAHPGVILPGVIGGISLILSFFAMQTLPVNFAGVLLILLAIILFIAEIKVASHGILTIGGIISMTIGSLLLFDSSEPALRVSWSVMATSLVVISIFFISIILLVLKAQLKKKQLGIEGMIGLLGEAVTDICNEGKVRIGGEYWNASSEKVIQKGKRIKVVGVNGIKVKIEEI